MTDLISREAALAQIEDPEQSLADVIDRILSLPAAQVKVKPLKWRESVGPQGVEWNAFCALLDRGWTAYSGGAMREIEAVRAARVLAVLDLSPKAVDASQTPDPVINDPRVKALVELLREANDDLKAYVDADWPEDQRAQYPSYQRKWERDMELCNRIDTALRAIGGEA